MTISIRIVVVAVSLCTLYAECLAQSTLLDNAQHRAVGVPVNDVVYDPIRDVLYASIPSTAGAPYGNSIATIDPATGNVLDSIFVGSEPNALAISDDASRVYVSVDGVRSVRWWQPADDQLGALRPLVSQFGSPAVAYDLAVPPGRPNVVVVSVDEVASTANGDLEVFTDTGSMRAVGTFDDANFIGFINATTMLSFDDSNTGFRGKVWQLDDLTLTSVHSKGPVVNNFDVEAEMGSDGLMYFTDGTVLEGSMLNPVGTYTTGLSRPDVLVQPVPALELTYFVGPPTSTSSTTTLKAFSSQNFLQIDSVNLPIIGSTAEDRGEFIIAGQDRLAFVWKPQMFAGPGGSGTLHLVSGIPVELPSEPVLEGDFNGDGSVDAADYTTWRGGLGTTFDDEDYLVWRNNYGATSGAAGSRAASAGASAAPEPGGATLIGLAAFGLTLLFQLR
jgi:hypothetical protein